MTYLTSREVKEIIHLCGLHVRLFLGNANASDFTGDARLAIEDFYKNPNQYSNERLLEKGANVDEAHQNNVRIELRSVQSEGAAQVVAKGIWGKDRENIIVILRKEFARHAHPIIVRSAGASSLEFNRAGVDKSLPIYYVKIYLKEILKDMGYAPGPEMNILKEQIVIAADGDGTVYDGPKLTHLPLLKESPVFTPLVKYLKAGGIFLLISGNDLTRTFKRVIEGMPNDVYHRILIAANGGADLASIGQDGKLHFMMKYRQEALERIGNNKIKSSVHIIYLGDDASPNGNDRAAFDAVGKENAILVKGLMDTKNYFEKFLNERKISSS